MKKWYLLITTLIIFVFIVSGCGGGDNGSGGYQIKIVYNGQSVEQSSSMTSSRMITMGVGAANDPVVKDASWWVDITPDTDNFSPGRYVNGEYLGQGGCTAIITDFEGHEITIPVEEEEQIVWACLDPEKITMISDLTGYFVAFRANGPGVVRFTVVYGESNASAQIVFMNDGRLDVTSVSPTVGQGYIFSTDTTTDNLTEADWWIERRDNKNYLCAPGPSGGGGISKILNAETIVPIKGISWEILACVLKVPDNLTYVTELPCDWYCSYIVKTRSGSHVKLQSFTRFTSFDGASDYASFLYEYIPTGTIFNNHF